MTRALLRKWRTFGQLRRKLGFMRALQYGANRTLSLYRNPGQVILDLERHYSFTDLPPFGGEAPGPDGTINWVIPDFSPGSGGHLNIFRLIQGLEQRGYVCRVVIVGECQFPTAAQAKSIIHRFFFPIKAEVVIGHDSMKPAWATFATSWPTAYVVRSFRATRHKLYFVQDYEPFFYARGSEYALAEATYSFGFVGITAGQWLAQKLKEKFGMETFSYGFSYDRALYSPRPRRDGNTKHVFFYARPVTQRRGFELGVLALSRVAKQFDNVAVIFAGWDVSQYRLDFPHLNAGVVPLEELPDLYSQCDVALVLSFTNLSLLPLELMACGCPVISNRGPNVEWLLDDSNAVLVEPTVEEIVDGLTRILLDEGHRIDVRQKGLTFASGTSWDHEIERLTKRLGDLRCERAA